MLPAPPHQSIELDNDGSQSISEEHCLCSLLSRTRHHRFDGWEQRDVTVGGGAAPRGDVIKKSKLPAKEHGALVGAARVYEFKHRADDISWYIKEYRDKCSKNVSKTAKLPLLTISRQLVPFRKPQYAQTTVEKPSGSGRQRAAATTEAPPSCPAEDGKDNGGGDDLRRPALTFSASSDERRRWYETDRDAEGGRSRPTAEHARLARSATIAVPDDRETSTIGAEPPPFLKARSASVLDRAAPPPPSPPLPSEVGFMPFEERSRRASTKSRAPRRQTGAAAASAAEAHANVCVKEREFVIPLPVKTKGVAGKSSTRVGAHARQAVDAPALRMRELGISSKLAKTLGALIEDFRLERLGLADRRPAAAAAGVRSRSRAARAEKPNALYYHLPLANSLTGFAEGFGRGGAGGGGGGGGRMGHAELFDFSSTASAAASYGPGG